MVRGHVCAHVRVLCCFLSHGEPEVCFVGPAHHAMPSFVEGEEGRAGRLVCASLTYGRARPTPLLGQRSE